MVMQSRILSWLRYGEGSQTSHLCQCQQPEEQPRRLNSSEKAFSIDERQIRSTQSSDHNKRSPDQVAPALKSVGVARRRTSLKHKLSSLSISSSKHYAKPKDASERLYSILYQSTSAGTPRTRSSHLPGLGLHRSSTKLRSSITTNPVSSIRSEHLCRPIYTPPRPERPIDDQCPGVRTIDLKCARCLCTDEISGASTSARTKMLSGQTCVESRLCSIPEEQERTDVILVKDTEIYYLKDGNDPNLVGHKDHRLSPLPPWIKESQSTFSKLGNDQDTSQNFNFQPLQYSESDTHSVYDDDASLKQGAEDNMSVLRPSPLRLQKGFSDPIHPLKQTGVSQIQNQMSYHSREAHLASQSQPGVNHKQDIYDSESVSSGSSSYTTLSTYSEDEDYHSSMTLPSSPPFPLSYEHNEGQNSGPSVLRSIRSILYDGDYVESPMTEIDNIYGMYDDEVQKRLKAKEAEGKQTTSISSGSEPLASPTKVAPRSEHRVRDQTSFPAHQSITSNARKLFGALDPNQALGRSNTYHGITPGMMKRLDSFPRIPSLTPSEISLEDIPEQTISPDTPHIDINHKRFDSGFGSAISQCSSSKSNRSSARLTATHISGESNCDFSSNYRDTKQSDRASEPIDATTVNGSNLVETAPFPLKRVTIKCRGSDYPVLLSQDGRIFEAPCWKHGCSEHTKGIFGATTQIGNKVMRTIKEV